jgi:hypothetical protein
MEQQHKLLCFFAHISSNEKNTRNHVQYHHPDVDFCNRSKGDNYYRPALPELRSCETCGIYIGKEIKHGSNEMHIFLLKNIARGDVDAAVLPHTAAGTVLAAACPLC